MTDRVIDFRSDTVTRPSPAMRRAMKEAPVGDDVFGEDPTVNLLQERTAELLGKEAGLFCPSGTMSNQVALHSHTRSRGDEVFLHARAHIVDHEQGSVAALSSLQLRCFDSEDGTLDPQAMEEHVHGDGVHFARTRVVALENTHNHCGGLVYPQGKIEAVRQFCDTHGLALHLDGARIWNAHVATGVPLAEIAAPFDSVSVCLSKGLGAPVGSVLLGDVEFIRVARRVRKVFGGGMRQTGILAAAGLYALEHNIERIADDHRRCRILAERLVMVPGLAVDLGKVQTNMVYIATVGTGLPARVLVDRLVEAGVWCLDEAPWELRFVTHLDLGDGDVEEAAEIIAQVVEHVVADRSSPEADSMG